MSKKKTTVKSTTRETYMAKDVFEVALSIIRSEGEVSASVRINRAMERYTFGDRIALDPEEIPALMKDLEWAYERWLEAKD